MWNRSKRKIQIHINSRRNNRRKTMGPWVWQGIFIYNTKNDIWKKLISRTLLKLKTSAKMEARKYYFYFLSFLSSTMNFILIHYINLIFRYMWSPKLCFPLTFSYKLLEILLEMVAQNEELKPEQHPENREISPEERKKIAKERRKEKAGLSS